MEASGPMASTYIYDNGGLDHERSNEQKVNGGFGLDLGGLGFMCVHFVPSYTYEHTSLHTNIYRKRKRTASISVVEYSNPRM